MKTINKRSLIVALFAFILTLSLIFAFVPLTSATVKAEDASSVVYMKGARAYAGDDADTSAIRFVAGVDESLYEDLKTANPGAKITFGMLIAPDKGETLTLETPNVKNYTYDGVGSITDDGDYELLGDITYKFDEAFWAELEAKKGPLDADARLDYTRKAHNMDLVARPYYVIGESAPVLCDQIEYARSIRNVINYSVLDGVELDTEVVNKYLGTVTTVTNDDLFFDDHTKEIIGFEATDGMTYSVGAKTLDVENYDATTKIVKLDSDFTADVKPGEEFVISAFDAENNVKRITVKNASLVLRDADDITWLFGSANATTDLAGYYVLGNDIDASTANVKGGIRFDPIIPGTSTRARFHGTFDGRGHIISNLNVSGGSKTNGSLFGQLGSYAVIKNVAFVNALATKGAVVASHAYNDWSGASKDVAKISNVYVSVNNSSTNFRGAIIQGNMAVNNLIVDFRNSSDITSTASFMDTGSGLISESANNFAISKLNEICNKKPDFECVSRFDTLTAMKEAYAQEKISYETFDSAFWTIIDGIPVWNGVNPKDDATRALSVEDDTDPMSLDLSGLSFDMSDVKAVTINGTKLDVVDGKLPAMTLVCSGKSALKLTVTGIANAITINKVATNKDFDPIAMTMHFADGTAYELLTVQVYSLLLKDAGDFKFLFGSTATLTGYYALANDITATESTCRTTHKFRGLFDGMGHVITNAHVYSNDTGSLFGQLNNEGQGTAIIRNVAFNNFRVNNSALVYDAANGGGASRGVPEISNVYLSFATNSTNCKGFIYAANYLKLNNCIVEMPFEQSNFGSLLGTNRTLQSGSANNYVVSKTPLCVGVEDSTITCAKRYDDMKGFIADVTTSSLNFSTFNYCWEISADGIPVWSALQPKTVA